MVSNATIVIASLSGGSHATVRVPSSGRGSRIVDAMTLSDGQCYVAQVSCAGVDGAESKFMSSAPVCIDETSPLVNVAVVHPASMLQNSSSDSRAQLLWASSHGLDSVQYVSFAHIQAAAPQLQDSILASLGATDPVVVSPALAEFAFASVEIVDTGSGISRADVTQRGMA